MRDNRPVTTTTRTPKPDAALTAAVDVAASSCLAGSVAEPRFRTWLLGSFAVLALVLSAAGIYGLVSYLVSRRTREIAIRIAIGAQRRDVYWLVSRQTIVSTCIGLAAGLAGAAAVNRVLVSGLQGVGRIVVRG